MDSLNSNNKSATSSSPFAKHKFDRAEPDGAIIIPTSGERVSGGREEPLERRKQLRIMGIVGAVVAVVLLIGIVAAFVLAPKKVETKEIDRGAVADVIKNNQSEDLQELEKIFTYAYEGKFAIYQIYPKDVNSLSEHYSSALQSITTIYNELTKYSKGYTPTAYVSRFNTTAEFIKNRQNIYTDALELIDDFHTLISENTGNIRNTGDTVSTGNTGNTQSAALTKLQDYDDIKVQKILDKVQQDFSKISSSYAKLEQQNCTQANVVSQTCNSLLEEYTDSGTYINSSDLLVDILNVISEPIDYATESYIYYNLDTLKIDLENNQTETTTVLNPMQNKTPEQIEETKNEEE